MRYQLLSKSEFQRAMRKKPVKIIDLRSPEDYRRWHIEGAENQSYEKIHLWAPELASGVPILVYCSHGNESILAARYLGSRGFRVGSLIGGVGRR